jgi:PRTRC genetic system protein E
VIIDFKELSALVPEKGSLILTFKRSNGKMTVCYAPRYDGKEENTDFRPVTVTGTPEELNEEWNETISEISKNERLLVTASSTSNLTKRKTETEKALTKTSKTGSTGDKKCQTSGSASDNSLFTPAKKGDEPKDETAKDSTADSIGEGKNEDDDSEKDKVSQESGAPGQSEKEQEKAKPTIF